MKMIILFLAGSIGLASVVSAQENVELKRTDHIDRVTYSITNKNVYPVTVTLEGEYRNLKPSSPLPVTEVIPALSEKQVITFNAQDKRVSASVRVTYSYFMGDVNAHHHNEHTYQLPYRLGDSRRVSQTYNGTFSHTGQLMYAVDFEMPVGTGVYASRSGVVVDLEERFDEGGEDPSYYEKTNFVTIMHSDGTFADYTHLRVNGVMASIGQRVRTGQLIAYSGATGYVSGPHLHFHVKMVDKNGNFYTIPTRFRSDKADEPLVKGVHYKAL